MSHVVLCAANTFSSAETLFKYALRNSLRFQIASKQCCLFFPYHKQTVLPVLSQPHTFYLTFPDPQKTAQPLFKLRCLFSFVFRADSVVFTILRNEVFLPPEAGLGSDLRCALIRGS